MAHFKKTIAVQKYTPKDFKITLGLVSHQQGSNNNILTGFLLHILFSRVDVIDKYQIT